MKWCKCRTEIAVVSPSDKLQVCRSLQHAHSSHRTPLLFSAKRVASKYPHRGPHTKYMHVNNSRYTCFSKMTSVEASEGLSRADFFWTEQTLSQWKLQWIESDLFSFLKESVLLGMKKDFGHFRMNTSECGLSMDNATCPLHGFIKWVRHLWPSGDWEPVFACRESRSKQARDRPRWSVLDSACWARRQILS